MIVAKFIGGPCGGETIWYPGTTIRHVLDVQIVGPTNYLPWEPVAHWFCESNIEPPMCARYQRRMTSNASRDVVYEFVGLMDGLLAEVPR